MMPLMPRTYATRRCRYDAAVIVFDTMMRHHTLRLRHAIDITAPSC